MMKARSPRAARMRRRLKRVTERRYSLSVAQAYTTRYRGGSASERAGLAALRERAE
jgi:hypothetical protein